MFEANLIKFPQQGNACFVVSQVVTSVWQQADRHTGYSINAQLPASSIASDTAVSSSVSDSCTCRSTVHLVLDHSVAKSFKLLAKW